MLNDIHLFLETEDDTTALAQALAGVILVGEPGGRIHLHGDLGAGKTAFARGLLRAAGVTGRIRSPSYTLLESYNISSLYFYHLDFYRFRNPNEWLDAGFRDILDTQAITLIEWPELAQPALPAPDLDLSLEISDTGRTARLSASSDKGKQWLTTLDTARWRLPPPASPDGNC